MPAARNAKAATRAAENEREDPLEQKRVAAKKSTDRDQRSKSANPTIRLRPDRDEGSVGAKASSN